MFRWKREAGIEHFKQLWARSFFHTLRQGNRTHYVMHDLIHDLVQMVSCCDCARMEGNKSKNIPSTVRMYLFQATLYHG